MTPPAAFADQVPLEEASPPSPGQLDAPIRSEDLLGDRACIFIEHGGMIYALRTTRAGKLILTK